jgi:hypothetical protein
LNVQLLVSPTVHVPQPHKQAPAQVPDAQEVVLRRSISIADITINGRLAADDQAATPAFQKYSIPALADAVWMVPDGDGWAEVYGDGDGWPVYEGETWAPAVSYDDCWAVPNGDGWAPYESIAR